MVWVEIQSEATASPSSAQAIAIFDRVGSDNLKLQYDIYHMQRMEGELAKTIERLFPRIAHFQIAGNPNRTEPDRGEIFMTIREMFRQDFSQPFTRNFR
jgi:hydroxypyruvate isomerase